jgi:hypothetical protein
MPPGTDTRTDAWPTPHADVNTLLRVLRGEVLRILGPALVGMYLSGSLALCNLTAGSDVDVVVATEGELSDKTLVALRTMHDRLYTSGMRWADQIEMVYVPVAALRRHDPARANHPYRGRGPGEHLRVITLHTDRVVQRVVLRDRGIILTGPPLTTLIDPISMDELRSAQVELTRFWWAPMVGEGAAAEFLRQRGHQSLAVLTMCRMLYTLRTGEITSKSAAACCGQANLDPAGLGSSNAPTPGARTMLLTRASSRQRMRYARRRRSFARWPRSARLGQARDETGERIRRADRTPYGMARHRRARQSQGALCPDGRYGTWFCGRVCRAAPCSWDPYRH